MKANKFIKKFGLDGFKAAMLCPQFKRYNYAILYSDEVDFSNELIEKHLDYMFKTADIERLVESHRLIEVEGGIDQVKDTFSFAYKHGADELTEYGKRLKQAIADVESCQ